LDVSVKKKHFIGFAEVFFSLCLASIITVGRSVYNYNSVSGLLRAPKENAAVFLFLFFPVLLILAFLGKAIDRNKEKESFPDDEIPGVYKAFPVMAFILTAASSALALLSYFPGILGYDSEWQTLQAYGVLPLSNHHPVLHTLIWNFFVALEWWGVPHPYGLVIYCIFQILIVSLVCALVVRCEIREGCRWFLPVISILFYALYPAFGVFSIQMTKDVLFGSAVILLILNLLKAGRGEKTNPFFIFLFTVLSSLLRNNFLPAGCVLVIVLFFLRKDKMMRKALIASLAGVIVSLSVVAFVYPTCGVEGSESHESLSVPINQVAAVYVHRYSELTLPEKYITEVYMSAGAYNPRLADTVKFSFNDELYDSDRSAFWDLYLHLFRKYPGEFIDAFLTQNVQLWYPGASVTDRYSAREYIETDNVLINEYTVSCTPVIPEMKGLYDRIFEEIKHSGVATGLPFSLSIPFIVLMISLYLSVKEENKGFTAAVLLSGALWATYLLGPVSAFRYMYPFFMLIPVMIMPVFARKKKPEKIPTREEKDEKTDSETVIDLD